VEIWWELIVVKNCHALKRFDWFTGELSPRQSYSLPDAPVSRAPAVGWAIVHVSFQTGCWVSMRYCELRPPAPIGGREIRFFAIDFLTGSSKASGVA
jgi:hypothetical protein